MNGMRVNDDRTFRLPLTLIDDAMLYDSMRDMANMLDGKYIERWSKAQDENDSKAFDHWWRKSVNLRAELERVRPHDRAAMIRNLHDWENEWNNL